MSSFPLFSIAPAGRPDFTPGSKMPARAIFVNTLRASSLPMIVPASRLAVHPAPELVSSGIRELDALTGGLPRGCLSEICGPNSSGRTSLLLAALAAATQREEACALVDVSDSFDPESAALAGVSFERLLWVRCEQKQKSCDPHRHKAAEKTGKQMEGMVEQALRVTDLLLQSGGFGLVAINLADVPFKTVRRIPLASWFRFQRAVEHTPTVLLAITPEPCAQTCATLLLKMQSESLGDGRRSLVKKPSAFCSQLSVEKSFSDTQQQVDHGNTSHTQLLEGFHVHTEILRSRVQRKPARSVTAAFTTKAVRTG